MKQARFTLSEREEEILQAVSVYRFLTVSQVCRLFFSEKSQNYAGAMLKHLTDTRYLVRFPLPSTRKGNREFLYSLGRPGIHFLKNIGVDMRFWSKNAVVPPSYLFMQHSLDVNTVLIAGAVVAKQVQGVELRALYHEWTLKHRPLVVPAGAHTVSIVPDGFLDFRLHLNNATYQTGLWVEVDKGTEDQAYVRNKVRALSIVLTRELYKDYVHAESMVVAFATTGGSARLKSLRLWIEEELQALHAVQTSDFFLLAALPDEPDPLTLFLRPVWSLPFTSDLQTLLDLSS